MKEFGFMECIISCILQLIVLSVVLPDADFGLSLAPCQVAC